MKILFDDDNEEGTVVPIKKQNNNKGKNDSWSTSAVKRISDDIEKKWYELFDEYNTNEIIDIKDSEQNALNNACKKCFDEEAIAKLKDNPSDAKWLQTALHQGTSKDRANAGALLVQSNPLPNLPSLEILIDLTKLSNKNSPEVIDVLCDLFTSALLPSHRKLIPLTLRAGDWKLINKSELDTSIKNKIFAYWQFENDLREHYFEYLKNLQNAIQTGQDVNKCKCIIVASKLLVYSPEKEQMLLTMLVNKLGDPSLKVASKVLYHLTEVAYKHPNMCEVIVSETEKLLFRNNLSDGGKFYGLCYLAEISKQCDSTVCLKLIKICFHYFKLLTSDNKMNNNLMKSLLICLRNSINNVDITKKDEILTDDMEKTIYKIIHLSDLSISLQGLSLLLQIITKLTIKNERYYNALYSKLLDIDINNKSVKIISLYLHIMHKSMYLDTNIPRIQSFIKRLLQTSLYFTSNITCGILIIISKLIKARPEIDEELIKLYQNNEIITKTIVSNTEKLKNYNSDDEAEDNDEEKYVDADIVKEVNEVKTAGTTEAVVSSWYHQANVAGNDETKDSKPMVKHLAITTYSPFIRNPMYCGSEFSLRIELRILLQHVHPTVRIFAENLINNKAINYDGDPLRDFSISFFLERFSFKNPKKMNQTTDERTVIQKIHQNNKNKTYRATGSRGVPVNTLSSTNCTEDEVYIFDYLECKRAIRAKYDDGNKSDDSVDDDEFEEYLDGLAGKTSKKKLDYMKEVGSDFTMQKEKENNKKKNKNDDSEDDGDYDDDFAVDGDEDDDDIDSLADDSDNDTDISDIDEKSGKSKNKKQKKTSKKTQKAANDYNEEDDDDDGSVSLGDDNDSVMTFSDVDSDNNDEGDDVIVSKSKTNKSNKLADLNMDTKAFTNRLKNTFDIKSLFAAADDFSEIMQETGKSKDHGTLKEVFNKDKASVKQMKWEEKRHDDYKSYGKKRKFNNSDSAMGKPKFAKKNNFSGNKKRKNK